MLVANTTLEVSKAQLWTGRILCGLTVLFLLVDAGMKLAGASVAVEGTKQLGYPVESLFGIGAVLLASTILCIIPRTALFGAVLLTAYLGGAVATQVRVNAPIFSHVLFPVYVAALLWSGLYLTNQRVRAIISIH